MVHIRLTLTLKKLKCKTFVLLHFSQESKIEVDDSAERQFASPNTKPQHHCFQKKHFYYRNHHVSCWSDTSKHLLGLPFTEVFKFWPLSRKENDKVPNGIVRLVNSKVLLFFPPVIKWCQETSKRKNIFWTLEKLHLWGGGATLNNHKLQSTSKK